MKYAECKKEASIYVWFTLGRGLRPHGKNMELNYFIIGEYMVAMDGIYI